jgi:hydroxyethylthiazole kinase-like uncharacterized protein yjeF
MSNENTKLPDDVFTAAQVRAIDRAAIERHGIASYELMTRAAQAALDAICRRWPRAATLRVYCGIGNNAGDGYVLARLAAAAGLSVEVIAVCSPEFLRGDAARAYADGTAAGLRIVAFADGLAATPAPDVIIDALFGTGLDRPVEGPYAAAVTAINAIAAPVVALDLPSGLDADSGEVLGVAVNAALTITFVGLKSGLYLGLAPDYCGDIEFAGLDIPAAAYAAQSPPLRRLGDAELSAALPPRRRSAHKGEHGKLLLVGGGPGMGGAIRLAAEAALRCGAGLVYVATHPSNVAQVMAGRPEIICHGVESAAAAVALGGGTQALVLGPGLGQSPWAQSLCRELLALDRPTVVDADGLNWLASAPFVRDAWVLTPHPGEAHRLLGCSTAAVEQDRLDAVRALAQRFGAVAVLKGARSLVAEPTNSLVRVCTAGNPGMASPGMGDVLAGIIGSLLAQGLPPAAAASVGVQLHARAGDSAAAAGGQRGLLALDLMPWLRHWANPS